MQLLGGEEQEGIAKGNNLDEVVILLTAYLTCCKGITEWSVGSTELHWSVFIPLS